MLFPLPARPAVSPRVVVTGAGIVTPLVIGGIVAVTGSFVYALAFIAVIALLGALSYIVILTDVSRIELRPVAPAH